jgi:hypothetical protein
MYSNMETLKKPHIKTVSIILLVWITVVGYGQDENTDRKITIEVGADLVSSYVWRGMFQTGAGFQPTLSLSAYGITMGTWGSTDFSEFAKEVDFYLSYTIKGFSIGLSDYWWSGQNAAYFRNRGSHHIEANLSYTFSEKFPLSLEVNTMLSGDEDKDDFGKKQYSTYISANFPFSFKNIDCETGIGISPRNGMYSNKFDVVAITAKSTKYLQLSPEFTLPVFVELIFSPAQNDAFLVVGLRF